MLRCIFGSYNLLSIIYEIIQRLLWSRQLEQTLRLETGERERDSLETRSLAQQNVELRRRLEEEQAAYKRKLQAYQEGQQRQAQLVQKLQAKVSERLQGGR